MGITRIAIDVPQCGSYDCRVGVRCVESMGERLRAISALANCRHLLILTDSNVGPLHAPALKASLSSAGFLVDEITVPAGEESKRIAVAEEIWSALSQLGFDRASAICALGGGVVGDLAGFVAASYMRGIPVVHVPTSLLAMVDSSIGGKTAVNIPEGKNLVGAFHQPAAVFSDIALLGTLPESQMRCGFAEVAKVALLSTDDFFFWLDGVFSTHASQRQAAIAHALQEVVVRSVVFKSSIVAQDPFERSDVRACLNLGHTYGHALEKCGGYGRYSHGECVAEGMRFAARVAEAQVGASAEFTAAQDALLDKIGLGRLDADIDCDSMIAAMGADKKNTSDGIRFVLLQDLGKPVLRTVDPGLLRGYIELWKEAGR